MTTPDSGVTDSGDLAQVLRMLKDRTAPATIVTGQVTDVTGGVVTVNIGGTDQVGEFTLAPVDIGDNVLVAERRTRRGVLHYVLGATQPKNLPLVGKVISVPTNSYILPIGTEAGTVSAIFPASYTPTANDDVYLVWQGTQAIVIGTQGKTGAPPARTAKPRPSTPPAPPKRPITGTTTFTASQSGTYRSGDGWRDDANGNVIQGTAPGYGGANDGAWFYGGRPHASLAGARVTKAQIYLGRTQGGNYGKQSVHLQRVTQNQRPGGNVTFTGSVANVGLDVGDKGWFTIPAALGQAVVDSGGSLGVQASSGPYVRLFGLSNSGQAGALRLTWSRDV